jgi:small subunit ribosomal protein S8
MIDQISDMLTRIRNANSVGKREVVFPCSKVKFSLCKLLEREGWIGEVELIELTKATKTTKETREQFKQIKIILKYDKNNQPQISSIKRISRPGQRIYVKKDNMPVILNGLGLAVISTPQGLMTNKEARAKKIGGELFFEVW